MTGRLFGALSTMLGLVGLYLVLANSGNFREIIGVVGGQLRNLFRTLQARDRARGRLVA